MSFAQRGLKIHCVELGEKLASLLKENCEKYPRVTIDVSPFETWQSNTVSQAQLIYSAAAFHWIDKNIKYKKCGDLLSDNGFLALMWHEHTDDTPEIITKSYELLERYSDKQFHFQSRLERRQRRIDEIKRSGYFTLLETFEYKWMSEQTPDEFIKAFKSQSSYLSLDHQSKQMLSNDLSQLLSHHNEPVNKEYVTAVYLAQKKAPQCEGKEA